MSATNEDADLAVWVAPPAAVPQPSDADGLRSEQEPVDAALRDAVARAPPPPLPPLSPATGRRPSNERTERAESAGNETAAVHDTTEASGQLVGSTEWHNARRRASTAALSRNSSTGGLPPLGPTAVSASPVGVYGGVSYTEPPGKAEPVFRATVVQPQANPAWEPIPIRVPPPTSNDDTAAAHIPNSLDTRVSRIPSIVFLVLEIVALGCALRSLAGETLFKSVNIATGAASEIGWWGVERCSPLCSNFELRAWLDLQGSLRCRNPLAFCGGDPVNSQTVAGVCLLLGVVGAICSVVLAVREAWTSKELSPSSLAVAALPPMAFFMAVRWMLNTWRHEMSMECCTDLGNTMVESGGEFAVATAFIQLAATLLYCLLFVVLRMACCRKRCNKGEGAPGAEAAARRQQQDEIAHAQYLQRASAPEANWQSQHERQQWQQPPTGDGGHFVATPSYPSPYPAPQQTSFANSPPVVVGAPLFAHDQHANDVVELQFVAEPARR